MNQGSLPKNNLVCCAFLAPLVFCLHFICVELKRSYLWLAPILPVLKWTDEEDVLRRANNTAMGLGSSVWTNDVAAAERATAKLQSGIVWTNTHFEAYPFVGFSPMKHSGMGTELGVEGFKDCCNRQAHISRKLVADSH